ncbi:MAG: RagB/SusD family nutrient uptake outer membrane protein [Tannerellaceae bacterium]|jgi:tetratricopeptide (TPR) repeat protein|nr:RagB/SusD family nutrient uptake outer membrane protein [Tannerellaceae bacterium]
MKKYIVSSIIGIGFLFSSCVDLDQSPEGYITLSQYFQTEADAISAVSGVYAILVHSDENTPLYGDQILYLNDLAADYMITGSNSNSPETRAIASVSYGAGNYEVRCTWVQIYKGISRANIAIENIPNVTASEGIKTRLINEAKFLRALLYFNAVQFWGEIPLVLQGEYKDADLIRRPIDEVYAQIIKDLEDAENLPLSFSGEDIGRATSGAASALLARVYLVREDWENAAKYAKKVIDSNQYELFENYYDAFDPAKKNGKEHIFSAQFAYGQDGGSSGNSIAHCVWSTYFNGQEPVLIISDMDLFYYSYADGDQRREGSYAKILYNPETQSVYEFEKPRFRKYIDTTVVLSSVYASAINTDIIRYADVYLTLAEALNEQGGPNNTFEGISAYDAINEIRRRAFREGKYSLDNANPQPALHDFAGLSQEKFREKLRDERYFEFVTEQTRWFDLVRWKTLVKSVKRIPAKSAVSTRNYRFPIPQSERDLNPEGLWQNWGYEGATVENPYDDSFQ